VPIRMLRAVVEVNQVDHRYPGLFEGQVVIGNVLLADEKLLLITKSVCRLPDRVNHPSG
jgi:hypothetical protein